LTLLVGSSDL